MGEVTAEMESRLRAAFAPAKLIIEDVSHLHQGHAGAKRADEKKGETHFHLTIAAEAFSNLTKVNAQKKIYQCLAPLMDNPIHALSMTVEQAGQQDRLDE